MTLPKEFEEYTHELMGDALYGTLMRGLDDETPVSIRINPFKTDAKVVRWCVGAHPVPWCANGYYLDGRPTFTFDPLFHAGVYYVQEASSMFLDFILRQLVKKPVTMLDMCAAPGGKSTCAMSALPTGSTLFANEPMRTRAQILSENIQKFGHSDVIVTNNYAKDYQKTKLAFDVILTDVPCSGEGMFRKDANAVNEWSEQNVDACQKLQRSIVEDIWQCLKPGGILIYSTCTFNAKENEENVEWISEKLGAESITLQGIPGEWNITGALKGERPAYRFIPGKTKGEGLFYSVLRKKGNDTSQTSNKTIGEAKKRLKVLTHGTNAPTQKGKNVIPDISAALSTDPKANEYPKVEVDYMTAINYLRHEAIVLPSDTPRGIITVAYHGHGLGFAKNLGNRANNLYPQEWKIRSTHVPEQQVIVE